MIKFVDYENCEDYIYAPSTPCLPSLTELTQKVVLQMLRKTMTQINELYTPKETANYQYYDVFFRLEFLTDELLTYCSMRETITWTRISPVVKSKIKKIYHEQLIQQICAHRILGTAPLSSDPSSETISFYQYWNIDPIFSFIVNLRGIMILEYSFDYSFWSEVIEEILEKQYGPEKKNTFMKTMQRLFSGERPSLVLKNFSETWIKCSENMPLFNKFNRCFQGEYQNNRFIVAKENCNDTSCTKCRKAKLDQHNNVWLQISIQNIVNLMDKYLFEETWEHCNGGRLKKHLLSKPTYLQWLQTKNANTLLTKNHKLHTFNEKLQEFFLTFRDYMMKCLHENNHVIFLYRVSNSDGIYRHQTMPDFFNRESFLYVFIEEQNELDQFLTKLERESQKEIMRSCHYALFIIPQEKCMKFLPREIIKNKEKLCICYLMFDNFIDKVRIYIDPEEIWCDQVLCHPLQLSNLHSHQKRLLFYTIHPDEWCP